jgi:Cu(I)/Ag(I) efflux system protein CusF
MNRARAMLLLLSVTLPPLTACERATEDSVQPAAALTRPAQSGEHAAEGTVNSVDLGSGTVNITHEPVESIGWPRMTMDFKLAERRLGEGLEVGRRVDFRFRADDGTSPTVTRIAPRD